MKRAAAALALALLAAMAAGEDSAEQKADELKARCEAGGGCLILTRQAMVEAMMRLREEVLREALEQCGKRI